MKSISLGKTQDEFYDCFPSAPETAKKGEEKLFYPSLYLDNAELSDIAAEGTITLKYRITQDTLRTDYREGEKKSHRVEMEILEITKVDKSDGKETSREDQLDRLAEEVDKEDKE